jgi:transcriptional regulator
MYVPPHFSESLPEALFDVIEKNPFGVLVTNGKSGLDANHIPFLLNRTDGPQGVLHCHVARANSVWQDIATGEEVLAVFKAADSYVSPNWYPSKHEFHRQVPTWNYIVAHAHGRATIRDDERYIRSVVGRLTRIHESSEPQPWRMSDSSRDFIDAMVKAVVGIEIEISRLVGKAKLSQNKEVRDLRSAGEKLVAKGELMLGRAMLAAAQAKEIL